MTFPLTISQARLLLILAGKSDESAIRPGQFSGLEANDLVQALRAFTANQK